MYQKTKQSFFRNYTFLFESTCFLAFPRIIISTWINNEGSGQMEQTFIIFVLFVDILLLSAAIIIINIVNVEKSKINKLFLGGTRSLARKRINASSNFNFGFNIILNEITPWGRPHKWRHAFFDNYWHPLPPLSRFIVLRL